jgi:hypothetical protein
MGYRHVVGDKKNKDRRERPGKKERLVVNGCPERAGLIG